MADFTKFLITLLLLFMVSNSLNANPTTPPEAPVKNKILEAHDTRREDPYYWMKDKENPEVIQYLKDENAYTNAQLAHLEYFREKLYKELVGRIQESDTSAPYKKDGYYYYTRTEKGKNYALFCRKANSMDAAEEIYLDANQLAKDHEYFDLESVNVSPDGKRLAYAVDIEGDEIYTLHFQDLESGRPIGSPITGTSGSGEWDATGTLYYYLIEDSAKRPYRILRHELEQPDKEDVIVETEPDPLYFLGISKTQDERYLISYSVSKETTEMRYLPSDSRETSFALIMERKQNIQYWVEHHEGQWLIRTNEGSEDFKIVSAPVDEPENQREILPHREGVRIDDILPLRHYWIFFERSQGLDQIRIKDLRKDESFLIEMPDEVYTLDEGHNAEYETDVFQFEYESPIRPRRVFNFNLPKREKSVIKKSIVPSGHDSNDYTAYRIYATTEDGTDIPMTVFHRKDLNKDGRNPAFLYGYGSYGATISPRFRPTWLTWLERGFVVAIAHVRGGGLLGESWYQDGKFLNKKNTFGDFITCAEKLIDNNFTKPDRLVTEGGSAGGLLIGAVLNQRPDLFKAAIAAVPFVDVVTTMLDASIPLTTFEYEEWGNPQDPEYFHYMRTYSPYDNVKHQEYPALLVTAGLNDPRVQFWEPAKWVAKLRDHKKDQNQLLLKTNMDAGHMGASGRYEYLKEVAFEQAFLLDQLNLTP